MFSKRDSGLADFGEILGRLRNRACLAVWVDMIFGRRELRVGP